MIWYYHHSIFCQIELKMGWDLKTDKENSGIFIKKIQGKLDALYLFSATVIH